jgi:hypothetical protein
MYDNHVCADVYTGCCRRNGVCGECWRNIIFPQIQLHRVLNSLHRWRYSKTLIYREKDRKTYNAGKCGVFPHENVVKFPGALDHLHTQYRLRYRKNGSCSVHCRPTTQNVLTLNVELNPTYHLLALLGAHHILHVSRIRVKSPTFFTVGRDSSVGNNDSLRAGRSGDRIPVGARFLAPVQTGPGAHPASYKIGTGSFLGVKRPGLGAAHPPTSRVEVKEREDLYLYSTSGPSCPVIGWPLPLPYLLY